MASAFDNLAPRVMNDLMLDFGLTPTQAAGAVGNLGAGERPARHQEVNPTSGARRLWLGAMDRLQTRRIRGVVQSTRVRARQLRGQLRLPEARITDEHKHTIEQIKKTTTVKAAAETFEAHYEKAGIKNMAGRISYATRALALYLASPYNSKEAPVVTPTPTPAPAEPTAHPPAIPWYKSWVTVGSGSGLGASLVALLTVYKPGVPILNQLDTLLPPAIGVISTLASLLSRLGSTAQPVTLTQSGANQVAADKAQQAAANAPLPAQTIPQEAWNTTVAPVSMESQLAQMVAGMLGLPPEVRAAIPTLVQMTNTIKVATGEEAPGDAQPALSSPPRNGL
jgi:hypothetical protein